MSLFALNKTHCRHGSTDAFYELRLLREALGYSTNALNFDPTSSQLCAQLTGRLIPYIQHSGQLERYHFDSD